MDWIGIPAAAALEPAAPLVECAANTEVSIPACLYNCSLYPATNSGATINRYPHLMESVVGRSLLRNTPMP
ncbi:hypothetical protein OUZ56_017114 [Daphnia magna]|uniref:Uncharacterized protein n=1 Tax=Daphnia magna TaxID=35525 RepID=A0ABR0AS63_9CRUS|nr:hypothetical protein OUZ56_017114 [Daphnia magna]